MSEATSIALTQLVLWYDPTRVQTWPAFLATIPADGLAATPTDLGREFATSRMTSDGHSSAYDLVRNLPGLERRGKRLHLRGVGLIERTPAGYRLSKEGRALAHAYARSPVGGGWLLLLADALLGREPRVRALIGLLSEPGAAIEFAREGWSSVGYRTARLVRPGCPDVHPFAEDGAAGATLRSFLHDRAWWCLGDWREDSRLAGASDCLFTGQRSPDPSFHDIGLALRAALEVFHIAGLIKDAAGRAWLDVGEAEVALPNRGLDFRWSGENLATGIVPTLSELLPGLETPTGHVVASELRTALQSAGFSDPDRAIAVAEAEGRLFVYAEDYGQARHGRGLFGDPRKQLVKLRIVGGGAAR